MTAAHWGDAEQQAADLLIAAALDEDLGKAGDVTSAALISADNQGRVRIVSRQPGRLCGVAIGRQVLQRVDPNAVWQTHLSDGDSLESGSIVATLCGRVGSLLTAERTILNFMSHLCGVASLTRQYVDAVAATRAVILDTRKTVPGWRYLQKYAVRCGGGTNHRFGLWDAVLIKDNHLAALAEEGIGSLDEVVRVARERAPAGVRLTIEVDALPQLQVALQGAPDVVLLDNMDIAQLCEAVAVRDETAPHVLLEASGGVNLQTVAGIAAAGVERISIGALTHSAPALDLGFDWCTQS
jgi:nicotinate-nucleotide pyrophosphorylase (carboxylating)